MTDEAFMEGESAPARDPVSTRPLVFVISPAYHEEQNLHEMYGRLCAALDDVELEWEWLIIEDGSTDGTYARRHCKFQKRFSRSPVSPPDSVITGSCRMGAG